ncbi:HNH endonuclease [Escherichia coli]|nr:HNH endonuclease [Escherichia coli]
MNNESKFQHIKKLWYLRDGIVYSKRTGKPKTFPSKNKEGRRCQIIKVNGKHYAVFIHEAIFSLYHNRPIAEGNNIHHIDWNYENNAIENLIELTPTQHNRIHKYQCDDPLRGIYLCDRTWRFQWFDGDGERHQRRFTNINEAMEFRATIEEPRRQELRALGLNCKRSGNRLTSATMRQINKRDRLIYRCRH